MSWHRNPLDEKGKHMKPIDKLLTAITPENPHARVDSGQPVGREIGPPSVTALKGMVRKPPVPVTIAAMNVGEEHREKLTTYDPAEDLTSDEAIAIFMAEAFQTNDAAYIAHALSVVARAKGTA
uniref:hypothetical protein n=1 Tax=Sulfuriferula sp. GW6 TaxID=3345112 RepID=UPI0039F68A1B